MLVPILSGGLNLAITFTANFCGLTLAWMLQAHGGVDAGFGAFLLGCVAALAVGALAGLIMGLVIAYVGAHPILVSLAMMIFIRGLGEFLTRGGDISGFPSFIQPIGHGSILGIPIPLLIFLVAAAVWYVMLQRTRHGFSTYMLGSNIEATRYSGIPTKRTHHPHLHAVRPDVRHRRHRHGRPLQFGPRRPWRRLSADHRARLLPRRRRSVRRLRPGGAGGDRAPHPPGPLLRAQPGRRQPAPVDGGLGPVPDRGHGHPLRMAAASASGDNEAVAVAAIATWEARR